MQWDDARIFLAVAREGSFSSAAKRMGVQHSTVSRLTTVASAVYGSREYCAAVKSGQAAEKWIGVDCCDYHRTWTKQAWPQAEHEMYVDETSLTLAALKSSRLRLCLKEKH